MGEIITLKTLKHETGVCHYSTLCSTSKLLSLYTSRRFLAKLTYKGTQLINSKIVVFNKFFVDMISQQHVAKSNENKNMAVAKSKPNGVQVKPRN